MPRSLLVFSLVAVSLAGRPAGAAPLHLLDDGLPLDAPVRWHEGALPFEAPPLVRDETMLSPCAAAVLSVFLPGLGQTFSGRFQTGFVILAGYVLIALVARMVYDLGVSTKNTALQVTGYGIMAGDIGLWGWSVYDAYVNVHAGGESPYSDGH